MRPCGQDERSQRLRNTALTSLGCEVRIPGRARAARHSPRAGDCAWPTTMPATCSTRMRPHARAAGTHPAAPIAGNSRIRDLLRLGGDPQPGATGSRDAARRPESGPRRRAGRGHGCVRQPRLPAAAPVCPPARGSKAAGSRHRRAARRVYPRHFPVTLALCRRCWGHSSVCKKLYINGS